MSFLETVKEEWYRMLSPMEETMKKMEEQQVGFSEYLNGLPYSIKLRYAEMSKEGGLESILEDGRNILSAYRTKIENATEEDLVTDDLELMVAEFERLKELFTKNVEYFKSRERDFS